MARERSGAGDAVLNLEQVRTFARVVECGTLSRAAKSLGLSQSTVSARLSGLEEFVDARLLDRGGAQVRPTRQGRVLLEYARALLDTAAQALERLRQEDEEPRGELKIAASTVPAEYLLPPLLATFRQRFPAVALDLRVSDSLWATQAIVDADCDLAFVGARAQDNRRIVCEPFALDEIVLVAPQSASTGWRGSVDPAQLAALPLVRRGSGSGTQRAVDALLREHNLELTFAIQVGSTEAARRCVLSGIGASFLSRSAVQTDIDEARLRVIAFPGTPLRREFFRLRARARTLSAAADAFWSHVDPDQTDR